MQAIKMKYDRTFMLGSYVLEHLMMWKCAELPGLDPQLKKLRNTAGKNTQTPVGAQEWNTVSSTC